MFSYKTKYNIIKVPFSTLIIIFNLFYFKYFFYHIDVVITLVLI